MLDAAGNKFSKQHGAEALRPEQLRADLRNALIFLGQRAPPESAGAAPAELLRWAVSAWRLDRVPKTAAGPLQPEAGSAAANADEKNAFNSS